jgi:hypothetical protein
MSVSSYLNRMKPVYTLANKQISPTGTGQIIGNALDNFEIINALMDDDASTPLNMTVPAGTYKLTMRGGFFIKIDPTTTDPLFSLAFGQLALVNVSDPLIAPNASPIIITSGSKSIYSTNGTSPDGVENNVVFDDIKIITLSTPTVVSMTLTIYNNASLAGSVIAGPLLFDTATGVSYDYNPTIIFEQVI